LHLPDPTQPAHPRSAYEDIGVQVPRGWSRANASSADGLDTIRLVIPSTSPPWPAALSAVDELDAGVFEHFADRGSVCVKLYGGHPRYEIAHPKPRLLRRTMTPLSTASSGLLAPSRTGCQSEQCVRRQAPVRRRKRCTRDRLCMGALKLEARKGHNAEIVPSGSRLWNDQKILHLSLKSRP
jgi:hypothetical protein